MTQETTIDVLKAYWWTQNKRGDWRAKYRRTSVVKRRAYLTYRSLINSGKLQKPEHWPVHVTAIIHPLTHGRFDPENAAPMVKAILDGITQSGYWPDDNADYVLGPDYRLGEPSTEKGVYHITIRIEEEDKTLNEIIDWAKSRCHEAGLSRFDVRRKSDRDFYDGQVNAFHEMLELCHSKLGYSGSMPSEVPNQSEDAK